MASPMFEISFTSSYLLPEKKIFHIGHSDMIPLMCRCVSPCVNFKSNWKMPPSQKEGKTPENTTYIGKIIKDNTGKHHLFLT